MAARGNFCTVDAAGLITDRRAGRTHRPSAAWPCARSSQQIRMPGVEVFVEPVREHRFVVVFRGDDLGDAVNDTDPQPVRASARCAPKAQNAGSENTARLSTQFVAEAAAMLKDEPPTNMVTLRGFARYPKIADDAGSLRPATPPRSRSIRCTRAWPGWSAWTSLDAGSDAGPTRWRRSRRHWEDYDFFFLHYKYTDSTGEDGNFAAKVEMIEDFDAEIPEDRRARARRADRHRRPQHAEQAEEP